MSALDLARGHSIMPTPTDLASWPDLYATESIPAPEKLICAHFFIGALDWWLVELDHESRRTAFGFVCLGDPQNAEWGYFELAELAAVSVVDQPGVRLLIERDLC